MVVGVIAPVLGVLVIRKSLTRESIVGTLAFFGFIGHFLKTVGFTIIGFNFVEYGPEIALMGIATVIGTRIGRSLLSNLNEKYFLFAFRFVLVSLAFKLIVITPCTESKFQIQIDLSPSSGGVSRYYCPKGLLRRDPSNFRVRLSVVRIPTAELSTSD